MPKFKVTHNVKPKRTEEADCDTFEQLNNWIDKTFNIEIKNIKYQKPRLKVCNVSYLGRSLISQGGQGGIRVDYHGLAAQGKDRS
jgi:hypothetical protein